MDFQKLYEPYKTKDAPDVAEQLKWLLKQGIPQHIIDQAMIKVYDEIERGKGFDSTEKHSATWVLWMYLLKTAKEIHSQELDVYVKNLETFHGKLRSKWNEDLKVIADLNQKRWPLWKKILLFRVERLFK